MIKEMPRNELCWSLTPNYIIAWKKLPQKPNKEWLVLEKATGNSFRFVTTDQRSYIQQCEAIIQLIESRKEDIQ